MSRYSLATCNSMQRQHLYYVCLLQALGNKIEIKTQSPLHNNSLFLLICARIINIHISLVLTLHFHGGESIGAHRSKFRHAVIVMQS